jgi:hypothetical protein
VTAPVPLARKLGMRDGSSVLLVGAVPPLELGPPPAGVSMHRRMGHGSYDVILAFCPDAAALRRRLPTLPAALTVGGRLWLCWPKKTSGVATDLSDEAVRTFGLGTGLVDVKVAAIDAVWSGLCFLRRHS